MKSIGVIGAMEEEISYLKAKMEVAYVKNIAGTDFISGHIDSKSVVLVRCGIGMVNAAACAQVLCDLFRVSHIINIGVAGALSPEVGIGDIVISEDLVQHDFDATIFGYALGEIPQLNVKSFLPDFELVKIAQRAGGVVCPERKTVKGRIVSGDRFISKAEERQKLFNSFGAVCTEMEGAAIAQVCFLNKKPFVVIRAVSDNADDSAGISFGKFVEMAAKNSSDMAEYIIKEI